LLIVLYHVVMNILIVILVVWLVCVGISKIAT